MVALALCAAAAVAPTLAQDAPAAQGPPEVALVSTADELRTALDLGTKHVQVSHASRTAFCAALVPPRCDAHVRCLHARPASR